jgi:hypothetical protein
LGIIRNLSIFGTVFFSALTPKMKRIIRPHKREVKNLKRPFPLVSKSSAKRMMSTIKLTTNIKTNRNKVKGDKKI